MAIAPAGCCRPCHAYVIYMDARLCRCVREFLMPCGTAIYATTYGLRSEKQSWNLLPEFQHLPLAYVCRGLRVTSPLGCETPESPS